MNLTDNDLWVILGVLSLILLGALFGNLFDPNSSTNDLDEILGFDPAFERAQNELKSKLKR